MYSLERHSATTLQLGHTAAVPVSLRDLVAAPALDLDVRAGEDRLDRPVRWVAVSEHEDPTPWLAGGELVLFTGVRLPPRPVARDLRTYVERLLAAEVAALGFGVGVVHARCPRALVTACTTSGLPLVEVPRPTPFIAIGKELSRLLEAERAARLTQRLHRMRRLSAGAGEGADTLVQRLAGYLDGWCLLLDVEGAVLTAHPRAAESRLADASEGVRRVQAGGLATSASLSAGGERIDVLPLGVAGRLSGLLVCGASGGEAEDRGLVAYAASLLSLGHGRDEELSRARRLSRGLALRAALDGRAVHDLLAMPWADGAVRIASLAASPDEVVRRLDRLPETAWAVAGDGELGAVAVWHEDQHSRAMDGLAGVEGGVSDPVRVGDDDQESLAGAAAVAGRRRCLARAGELVATDGGTLLDLLEPGVLRTWAQQLLQPVVARTDGDELLVALRASLAHPGSTEEAAQAAGVHRHTLRRRLHLVGEVLGADTGDPRVRAELLLALAAADG